MRWVAVALFSTSALLAGGPEILQKRCLSCHNPQAKMGGLTLHSRTAAAGVLAEKLLARVQAGQMPPGGGLPPEERAEIAAWIANGAPWEKDLAIASRPRAGKDWWSLQPLRPNPAGASIDSFIQAKLAEKGLKLSPPADRRTLIRRATFDLTGLPPTPAEVESFVASGDYEALIDRLLASPAYGERWGRHWLDVIRFGESNGYEQNHVRPNAWPFRDFVIRSLNEDVSFQTLILHHLAGDLASKSDINVQIGSAFLVAGPHDTVGNQAEAPKRQQRADDHDDMVNATASAFLGLTVNCAKCHDHKFDPILQADYYRLAAVFAGVYHGEREVATAAERAAYQAAAGPLEARINTAKETLSRLTDRAKPGLSEAEKRVRSGLREPVSSTLTAETFRPVSGREVTLELPQGAPGGLDEIEIFNTAGKNVAAGAAAQATSTRVAEGNPDAYSPRFLTDSSYDKRWFGLPGQPVTVRIPLNAAEIIQKVQWSSDRLEAQKGKFQVPPTTKYTIWIDGKKVASGDDRLPPRKEQQERLFTIEALNAMEKQEFTEAERQRTEAEETLAKVPKLRKVYAGQFREPDQPVYLLKGGNVMLRGEAMAPGSLSALPGFTLPLDAPEGERRLALAKWIGSDANPLTPRVLVNRLWHNHFGRGLVATPSDFGFNGERPSHPELLDYLAQRLIANGWKMKPIHREILLSATYRQSGGWNEAAAKADADARLLWRFPPQRLQGEAIRDSMLAAAGVLNGTVGGPSFQLYKYTVDNVATYFPMDRFGPETYRRSVYAQSARSIRNELLSVYDCPDSSLPEPRRVVTTSPLQALSLLNHSFTTDMAEAFAKRIGAEADPVGSGFAIAFGRAPETAERAEAQGLIQRHGMTAFTRALFNTNEFVYVY
ncbi:MAG TPA: DUF1553 domain-containing protein [Bryobacteraceae bacterium]|nr:DUF1553 domain-containing protein [Bryobacteraceae bacterium]